MKHIHKKLITNHPQVEKMWEWGKLPRNPKAGSAIYCLSILLKNGTRRDFETIDANQKAVDEIYQQADDYLDTL